MDGSAKVLLIIYFQHLHELINWLKPQDCLADSPRDFWRLCMPGGGTTMFNGLQEEPQVMLIEDVLGTRTVLKDMLAEMGITRVMEASDGCEAFEKIRKCGAQLILCDLYMDDMNGAQLLRELKKHTRLANIPFIVVSACDDGPVIKAARDLGAAEYIVKPVGLRELQQTIAKVLRQRTPLALPY